MRFRSILNCHRKTQSECWCQTVAAIPVSPSTFFWMIRKCILILTSHDYLTWRFQYHHELLPGSSRRLSSLNWVYIIKVAISLYLQHRISKIVVTNIIAIIGALMSQCSLKSFTFRQLLCASMSSWYCSDDICELTNMSRVAASSAT